MPCARRSTSRVCCHAQAHPHSYHCLLDLISRHDGHSLASRGLPCHTGRNRVCCRTQSYPHNYCWFLDQSTSWSPSDQSWSVMSYRKKQGLLPLTFVKSDDYDKVQPMDKITLKGVTVGAPCSWLLTLFAASMLEFMPGRVLTFRCSLIGFGLASRLIMAPLM